VKCKIYVAENKERPRRTDDDIPLSPTTRRTSPISRQHAAAIENPMITDNLEWFAVPVAGADGLMLKVLRVAPLAVTVSE
jgi:hypothetical protein